MKYEPIHANRELVENIMLIDDCTQREALVKANKHVKEHNKGLLITCIYQAKTVEDLKSLMVVVVNSI